MIMITMNKARTNDDIGPNGKHESDDDSDTMTIYNDDDANGKHYHYHSDDSFKENATHKNDDTTRTMIQTMQVTLQTKMTMTITTMNITQIPLVSEDFPTRTVILKHEMVPTYQVTRPKSAVQGMSLLHKDLHSSVTLRLPSSQNTGNLGGRRQFMMDTWCLAGNGN